jgi:signal peptidase complex subunit 3
VYLIAKWPTTGKPNSINEAVIWDQIIPADPLQNPNVASERRRKSSASPPSKAERGLIRLRNAKSKYQITDVVGKIAERGNATLELGWNVQPWVGVLTWTSHRQVGSWEALRGGRSKPFDFPELQVKKKSTGGQST